MPLPDFTEELSKLERAFQGMTSDDERAAALSALAESRDIPHIETVFSTAFNEPKEIDRRRAEEADVFYDFAGKHGLHEYFTQSLLNGVNDPPLKYGTPHSTPLNKLLCSNHDLNKNIFCENTPTMACSGCHLVVYCSKSCQVSHWKNHKRGKLMIVLFF